MPKFSILIPSRDRLNLLKLAIESVAKQDFTDYEVIVSDNASVDSYKGWIDSLKRPEIKYHRVDSVISVTENWNNALQFATGDYIIMLGDDDALTPGLLRKLNKIIKNYKKPDVIYMQAYHYLYPGVNKDAINGYLRAINNSPLFEVGPGPYRLDAQRAREYARAAVSFHHLVSFNAQHFVWRRKFTQIEGHRLFEPPYPDYFACFYTFLKANTIVVLPEPSVIIGISKQSFGYFFLNNRQDEGALAFAGENLNATDLSGPSDIEAIKALNFPGPTHYRNWLLASIHFKAKVEPSLEIDYGKYRKIQIVETLYHCLSANNVVKKIPKTARHHWKDDWSFVRHVWSLLRAGELESQIDIARAKLIMDDLVVYYPCDVSTIEMNDHVDIMNAFEILASGEPAPKISWVTRWIDSIKKHIG